MKPKILFIDRDGTIIVEPSDFQIDSLEKLEFFPKVISVLNKLAIDKKFKLVMVTNQDGLGTSSFPEDTFWPAHTKMLKTLEGEGIFWDAIHVDPHFEHQNTTTRKPGIGMLTNYLNGEYDIVNSYVIGDRQTDVKMAENLKCKAILLSNDKTQVVPALCELITNDWEEIYRFLSTPSRKALVKRTTKETDISIELNLDGTGKTTIDTGIPFFDHMLDQLGKHSFSDLTIKVKGDLHIDEHHTIEDTAIALGEAYLKAIGDKKGIERYGWLLPMDDCLAQVAIDFSGRPWIVWEAEFKREKIGEMPTEMFYHFFKSFSDAAKCNLNIKAEGINEHHKIEAIFKGLAKAIKMAVRIDEAHAQVLPSTKGVL